MKIWRLAGIVVAVAMIAISVAVLSVVVVNNTPDRALTDAAAQPEVVAALPASSEVAAASEDSRRTCPRFLSKRNPPAKLKPP